MNPSSNDHVYIAQTGKAIYHAMEKEDPEAVWMMQGWLFLDNFWQPPQIKAILTTVPLGNMIIPQWFNYRRHADIGFFKNFDFMVDMGSFNIQTNKKNKHFPIFKKKCPKIWILKI
jgi:hypothetical protein